MEPKYVILLDFFTAELIKIRLSDQKKLEESGKFEEFLIILEDNMISKSR